MFHISLSEVADSKGSGLGCEEGDQKGDPYVEVISRSYK